MSKILRLSSGIFLGLLVLFFYSCSTSYKKIAYFQDVSDSLYKAPYILDSSKFVDPVIQPNDILNVDIQTLDPGLSGIPGSSATGGISAALSSSGASSGLAGLLGGNLPSPSGSNNTSGYLVDKNGEVEIPMAGKIKVGGLTTAEARDEITKVASTYFVNPVVNVQIINFKVTVIGEVLKPGQYTIQDEKASILDAIGMAGDLTIFAKRENVLLVRTINSKKEFIRFDLNSSEIFKSPYFYLKQGDMIYVQPNKSKAAATDYAQTRNISLITSICTVIIVITSYILFK
jgi:polysaccharide biosynthesis/export protein